MEHSKKPGRTLQDYAHLFLSKKQEHETAPVAPQTKPAEERVVPQNNEPQPVIRLQKESPAGSSRSFVSFAPSPAKGRAEQHPEPAAGISRKNPCAIALCCPDQPLAHSLLTFNLCIDCVRRGLQVLVINADLSFPSMNFLSSLQLHVLKNSAPLPESAPARSPRALQMYTLDMDVTVLASPWPEEQSPIVEEISAAGRTADIILINTAVGFSANAKALFKAADETIVISGTEPAQLINAYSTIKLICQIAAEPRVSIIMLGADAAAESGLAKLQQAAQQFLGRSPGSYGCLPWDPDVTSSIKRKTALLGDSSAGRRLQEISGRVLTEIPRLQKSAVTPEPGFLEKLFVTSGQTMGAAYDACKQQRWSRS
jgi:MinD-like ATPase involved in chromosome partitioning or flagellar assembly